MQEFKVLRQHIGDQFYDPTGKAGPAVREADPLDVRHLVESGVLEAPENKAVAKVPETKAEAEAEAARAAQEEADRKAAEAAQAEADRLRADEAKAATAASKTK